MEVNSNKLAIAYRIYPGVSKVPPVFPDDKYRLAELCLKSFRQALGTIQVKLWVIFDSCPSKYIDLFKKYFTEEEFIPVEMTKAGNQKTFGKQMEILMWQDFSELIYFAEDDYFYLPDTIQEITELLKERRDIDFVTPYDHPDYYNHKLHNYPKQSFLHGNRHWRNGASTCMTFMTTKSTLKKSWDVFHTYTNNNYDTSLWLSLTKMKIRNPLLFLKFIFTDKHLAKVFLKSWLNTPGQNIAGKPYKLFVPVPTLATHTDSLCLAPGVNWEEEFNKLIEK